MKLDRTLIDKDGVPTEEELIAAMEEMREKPLKSA